MFLEGIVIIISLVVSIRSTLLQVMTKIPVQNDIIIIIPIYNFRVDTQDVEEKKRSTSSTKGRLKKWEDFFLLDRRKLLHACIKGPNNTRRKPSYSPPDCMHRFAQRSCVGMRRGDRARQWERSEEESFSNLATNICISQSTGVLFFARFYLSAQTKWGGKGLKCLKIWASACLCSAPPHPWNPQHE